MKSFVSSFKNSHDYKVIGLMSGTSEDGIDICFIHFKYIGKKWDFRIIRSITVPYAKDELKLIHEAFLSNPLEIDSFDLKFGEILALKLNYFIKGLATKPDFICSHGHTIFHQPKAGITVQIGNGQRIADSTKLPVVNNFRNLDVQLGGQGAPLVPIGDKLLFPEYDACLNLGGFSNISFEKEERLAFDISPANLPLNKFMESLFDLPYDNEGRIAASGRVDSNLLSELNSIEYYHISPPKSLGIEWLNNSFFPIVNKHVLSIRKINLISTLTEHIAFQIAKTLNRINAKTCLVTGGGTKNTYLLHKIKEHANTTLILPSEELIDFKEALIFGLLGILKVRGENNALKSVTGASRNSCGGELYLPG